MMNDWGDESQNCFFCNEIDIGSCVNRSLYHKYNDSTNKMVHRIDQIIFHNKQRSIGARKYQQIKRLIDDNENISKIMTTSMVYSSLIDLLEYYKYRKFVPIFTKSLDNLMITEQLHLYYYEKLKIYYNQIKKRLNITVEQSSSSEDSISFITKTQISKLDSQILQQLTSKGHKQSFRYYQTESKALQNLVNILKKQEHRLKKIKSLKTQDCTKQFTKQINPFKDNIHKKSKLVQYFAQNKHIVAKKNKRMFFRKIQQAKAFKTVQQNNKYKSIKKFIGQKSKASLYYQSLKLRSNSQSVFKLIKQNSKANIPNNQRVIFKSKPILQKSQQRRSYQNLTERQVIKSVPKVPTQFNIRPSRSLSSASIGYPNKQNNEPRLSSKIIILKKQVNTTKNQLIIDKNTNIVANNQKKKKTEITKTPYKDKLQIDQNDNLASINRKKIEQLKIKSQRNKQIKK